MRLRLTWLACVGGLVLVLAGCQRLHVEKPLDLNPGDLKYIEVDAPRGDQKVEIQVTATEPVDVFVVKEDQLREFDKKNGDFDKSKAITVKKGVKSETFQVTAEAGKKFGVILKALSKSSAVKVTIDGR